MCLSRTGTLLHYHSHQVIPRVNPLLHPGASYVSEDRSRLLCRLDLYGLTERSVDGDGNCQVGWVASQLGVCRSVGPRRRELLDQRC